MTYVLGGGQHAAHRAASELVDNLNANVHLGSVLTDLHLVYELLRWLWAFGSSWVWRPSCSWHPA